jgi:hypothetical protein
VSDSTRRVDRSRQLIPNFHLVTVRVAEEDVGFAGHEFTMVANRAASGADGGQRSVDVNRATQPEPKVYDAAGPAGLARLTLEDKHVPAARRLCLDGVSLLVDGDDADHGLVKAQRTLRIADRERYVREAVRFDR